MVAHESQVCIHFNIQKLQRILEEIPTMTKNNVYFLLLALALALTVIPVLTQSAFAAEQTKTLRIQLVDDETGRKVAGECEVFTDTGDSDFVSTNSGGQGTVTLDKDATSATLECTTGAGRGSQTVTLKESGVTRTTVVV
jgi:hypothetical protein